MRKPESKKIKMGKGSKRTENLETRVNKLHFGKLSGRVLKVKLSFSTAC